MEKSSFKLICVLCFCCIGFTLSAQVMQDANGRPIIAVKYTDVQGSPFFADNWIKGKVKMADGETFDNVDLKFDQVTDEPIFKNADGGPMTFVKPVNEFKLVNSGLPGSPPILFRNGYKPVNGNTSKTFYQILSDGETPLIKRTVKKVAENKPYGSATVIKTFEEIQSYFLVQQGTPVKIKKDKKAVLETLNGYQTELEEFIKSNNLNFKTEKDLVMLITYFNSLK